MTSHQTFIHLHVFTNNQTHSHLYTWRVEELRWLWSISNLLWRVDCGSERSLTVDSSVLVEICFQETFQCERTDGQSRQRRSSSRAASLRLCRSDRFPCWSQVCCGRSKASCPGVVPRQWSPPITYCLTSSEDWDAIVQPRCNCVLPVMCVYLLMRLCRCVSRVLQRPNPETK